MSNLASKIRNRFQTVSAHAAKLSDPARPIFNSDLIRDYGFSYFKELESHITGSPLVTTEFGELYGRPATDKAEQMRHARGLRRLEKAEVIQLFHANESSKVVKWCKLITRPRGAFGACKAVR